MNPSEGANYERKALDRKMEGGLDRTYEAYMDRDIQSAISAAVRQATTASDGRYVQRYIDGNAILGDPYALTECVERIVDAIVPMGAGVVAGEASAACGLIGAVVLRAHQRGSYILGRYIRKSPKMYGILGLFSSDLPPRSQVAIVDDVASMGNSLERTVQVVRHAGHMVVGAIVIVDRREGATERLARIGVNLRALHRFDRDGSPEVAASASPLPKSPTSVCAAKDHTSSLPTGTKGWRLGKA